MSSGSPSVVGKTALLDQPFIGSVGAFCGLVRPGPRLDPTYLAAWFRSPAYLAWRDAQSRGASIQNLRISMLSNLKVPVPELAAQHRTAAQLTDQLAAIDRVRSATNIQREEVRELADGVRDIALSRFANLPAVALGDVAGSVGAIVDGPFGSNLKTEHYRPTGARVVRLQNIGSGDFLGADQAYVALDHFATLTRHQALPGDVVVAALGDGARPAGRACVVPADIGPAVVKADCFRIRPPIGLNAQFLCHVLNAATTRRDIGRLMRGATRSRFTLKMLRDITVPIANLEDQGHIAAEIDLRLALAADARQAIELQREAINALPGALLRRVFDHEDAA